MNSKGLSALEGTVLVLILLVLAAGGFYLFSSSSNSSQYLSSNPSYSSGQEGRFVMALTDAAQDLESVSKIIVTVDSAQIHSTAYGWTDLNVGSTDYDLLELKSTGDLALVTDSNVSAGSYDQLRLHISKVLVVDETGTHEAKLPSNDLKFMTSFYVEENSTSTITLDVIADESLHREGNGQYVLAPVVQVESRADASVRIESDQTVKISGGSVNSVKLGMDETGRIGVGLKFPENGSLLGVNANSGVNVGVGGGY